MTLLQFQTRLSSVFINYILSRSSRWLKKNLILQFEISFFLVSFSLFCFFLFGLFIPGKCFNFLLSRYSFRATTGVKSCLSCFQMDLMQSNKFFSKKILRSFQDLSICGFTLNRGHLST